MIFFFLHLFVYPPPSPCRCRRRQGAFRQQFFCCCLNANRKYILSATLGFFIACLGAEVFQFPWRVIFGKVWAENEKELKVLRNFFAWVCPAINYSGESVSMDQRQRQRQRISKRRLSNLESQGYKSLLSDIRGSLAAKQSSREELKNTKGPPDSTPSTASPNLPGITFPNAPRYFIFLFNVHCLTLCALCLGVSLLYV